MDPWKGRNASGPRAYTDEQYAAVVAEVKHYGAVNPIRWAELLEAMPAGLFGPNDGRTVREIVSRADGVEFVVDDGDGGVYICGSYDQTQRKTANLKARVRSLEERVNRREQYAARELPRIQQTLGF